MLLRSALVYGAWSAVYDRHAHWRSELEKKPPDAYAGLLALHPSVTSLLRYEISLAVLERRKQCQINIPKCDPIWRVARRRVLVVDASPVVPSQSRTQIMFKFLRRVSTSFLSRPDRPWREDVTSNAPTIGRKRRFSFINHDDEEEEFGSINGKRPRTEAMQLDGVEASTKDSDKERTEGEEVKFVTKGVKQVDLEDTGVQAPPVHPEAIPLPESPSLQPVTLESTRKPEEPQRGTEVSEVSASAESVPPTEVTRNDTKGDDDSVASSEKQDTRDLEEEVPGASECPETVELHHAITDVADTEAGVELLPTDSAPSEEALGPTEEET